MAKKILKSFRVKHLNFEISENIINICVSETLENEKIEENNDKKFKKLQLIHQQNRRKLLLQRKI